DRARPGGRDAHADLTGELRVRAGHEGRELLVARLDELDPVLRAVERAHDTVDPVAGIAEYAAHAPGMQPLDDLVADGLAHAASLGAWPRDKCGIAPARGVGAFGSGGEAPPVEPLQPPRQHHAQRQVP